MRRVASARTRRTFSAGVPCSRYTSATRAATALGPGLARPRGAGRSSGDRRGGGGAPGRRETAVRTLDLIGVTEGTTVVINGASGAVGSAAVQIAVARGAHVIGTASESDHDYLRSLGAPIAVAAQRRACRSVGVCDSGSTAPRRPSACWPRDRGTRRSAGPRRQTG